MGAPLGAGGHVLVFGDVSVLQGAAGQEAWQGGLLHCAFCMGHSCRAGCSTSSDVPVSGPRRIPQLPPPSPSPSSPTLI